MKLNAILVLITLAALVLAGCQVTTPGPNATVTAPINIEINQTPAPSEGAGEAAPEEGIVIKATEGTLVQLRPEAYDPDKDVVHFFYTKPFNANGKWQTKEGDAGKYLVTVTASDGKSNTSQDIIVIITKANQAPVLECPEEITAKEGELIKLDCNIYDPEGESVIVEYSGFMKSSTYQSTYDDAGDYTTQIKARDKEKEAETSVKIKIIDVNRAPEITGVPETINAVETDVITLNPRVSDSDGDKVTVTFSEPFDKNGMWRTTIGDAGAHKASIVASDGKGTTKKEVEIVIAQKNTPPVLKTINDITVYEGETITITAEASDREEDKDKLDITVKGWMNSLSYTTTYEDAGTYTVTVTVSDGTYSAEQTFKVTVLDSNRPPVFRVPA